MASTRPEGRRVAPRLRWGEWPLRLLLAVTLGVLMVLTFLDVIGRYFLNAPVPASYELTELLMGILIFAALPLLAARDRHIKIDLLERLFRGAARRWRDGLVNLFSAGIMALYAWRLWEHALQLSRMGDITLLLKLPMAPIAFGLCGLAVLAAGVSLAVAILHLVSIAPSRHPSAPV